MTLLEKIKATTDKGYNVQFSDVPGTAQFDNPPMMIRLSKGQNHIARMVDTEVVEHYPEFVVEMIDGLTHELGMVEHESD